MCDDDDGGSSTVVPVGPRIIALDLAGTTTGRMATMGNTFDDDSCESDCIWTTITRRRWNSNRRRPRRSCRRRDNVAAAAAAAVVGGGHGEIEDDIGM